MGKCLLVDYKITIDLKFLLVLHIFVGKHVVDFLSGDWSLEFLSVQHLIFKLLDRPASLHEGFCYSPVPTTYNKDQMIILNR